MNNSWYPWLNHSYINIIKKYKQKKLHHTILVESYNIKNTYKIIWAAIRWILCKKKKNLKHCGACTGCNLIKNKIHPDVYILYTNNINKVIEIEKIRNTLNIIKNTSQQNNEKILWIPNYMSLTIFGINTLLKILEEPPKNTFFFIGNIFCNQVHKTFKSRCLLYQIFTPNEQLGLYWIYQNTKIKNKNSLVSLRINNNDPEAAKELLTTNVWIERIELYHNIKHAIYKNNFLILLPQLNTPNILNKIYWIILLILDSLKLKKKLFSYLVNTDQIQLIQFINNKYKYDNLNNILNSWIKCRYQIINTENINYELLILQKLLIWQLSK